MSGMTDVEYLKTRSDDLNDTELLEEMIEYYGLPEDADLYRLLRHIYASRDLNVALKDDTIRLLREENAKIRRAARARFMKSEDAHE